MRHPPTFSKGHRNRHWRRHESKSAAPVDLGEDALDDDQRGPRGVSLRQVEGDATLGEGGEVLGDPDLADVVQDVEPGVRQPYDQLVPALVDDVPVLRHVVGECARHVERDRGEPAGDAPCGGGGDDDARMLLLAEDFGDQVRVVEVVDVARSASRAGACGKG